MWRDFVDFVDIAAEADVQHSGRRTLPNVASRDDADVQQSCRLFEGEAGGGYRSPASRSRCRFVPGMERSETPENHGSGAFPRSSPGPQVNSRISSETRNALAELYGIDQGVRERQRAVGGLSASDVGGD